MKHSTIYLTLRPEIKERISVGIVFVNGDNAEVMVSEEKLEKLKPLFSDKVYTFLHGAIVGLSCIKDVSLVNYLKDYSNNLITFSDISEIDLDDDENTRAWLFEKYVYDKNLGY